MKKKKSNTSKEIIFLVALYSNLFFGYQYIQDLKIENKKNEALINDLKKRIK